MQIYKGIRMEILKAIGKTIGTATLVVTGTASTILKGVSDAVGFEIGSEILGAAKDASFNGIRSMWSDKDLEGSFETADKLESGVQRGTQSQMARTAKQAADLAKKNGDIEKYEYYMEQYERYKE